MPPGVQHWRPSSPGCRLGWLWLTFSARGGGCGGEGTGRVSVWLRLVAGSPRHHRPWLPSEIMLEGAGAVRGPEPGRPVVPLASLAQVIVAAGGAAFPVVAANGDVVQPFRVRVLVTR